MDDIFPPGEVVSDRPKLPEPTLPRWQSLRLGLVELFHYDAEEFWFRDGHLLLRGNNGTGKSKVLALTLPFLFDAQLRPSRIEPDGDPAKRMAWNLLMNSYDRRIGYAWIEFGRRQDDGSPQYLTLGAGLSAVAARGDVESWFFLVEGDRVSRDIWLINKQRTVLTRERLREAIAPRGRLFETASAYRRAVDEHLFRLGPRRYDALIDTLVQLRQPQLSRKPDETALSDALTEALPPLPIELLADVAEALGQLEEDRRQLEDFQHLAQAVGRFERRYRIYAGTLTRRQARELRQAQTDFDNASRDRNEAQTRLQQAQAEEAQARLALEQAELTLAGQRSRLETLQSDPTMQDANRLETAERDVKQRRQALDTARSAEADAQRRLRREAETAAQSAERADEAERGLLEARSDCEDAGEAAGLAARLAEQPLMLSAPIQVSDMSAGEVDAARSALRMAVATRREHLLLLRRRHADLTQAEVLLAQRQRTRDEKQEELDAAACHRADADAAVERSGETLIEAWTAHCATLRQSRAEMAAPLAALGEWVVRLDGDNPAQNALQAAQQAALPRLAALQQQLDHEYAALRGERDALETERDDLAAGRDAAPPMPYTRGADARAERAGAPLWQLIDFRDGVADASRAGLEAALEASGLLDAWVSPDGALQVTDGEIVRYDSRLVERPTAPAGSLVDVLCADLSAAGPVDAATVKRLLAGIACGDEDDGEAEIWVSADGRFRLGSLAGTWGKPQAVYIGFAARAAARARRLGEIAERLEHLVREQAALDMRSDELSAARRQAEREWRDAPSDLPLRQAHLVASMAARAFTEAGARLDQAIAAWNEMQRSMQAARAVLERDAADLNLPTTAEALGAVEAALNRFNEAQYRLLQAVSEWRRAWPDLQRQQSREVEAGQELERSRAQVAEVRREAEETQARFEVLREAVGARVDTLRLQLAAARDASRADELAVRGSGEALRQAGEQRAIAATKTETATAVLTQRSVARVQAVARLQRFTASGLFSSALPDVDVPDLRVAWTIDPALGLARRAEQALAQVKDDDESWARVQRQVAEDLQELQRALGALGHQAQAEPNDAGFVVHIVYQNRPQRPDLLAARLSDEIAQRSELLTAREREILENHLQAEIATSVQRLLQAAEKQLAGINEELRKRPTATGVRYRLQWLPLTEHEGAPVGLEAARQRLLRTSADLWSAEDRRVIGAMLQQRIAAERERTEAEPGRDTAGGLPDQLARALDYRRWHQFRVQRHQGGEWRKLSGPASSGERALGLTVPLFAAVSSFYGHSQYPHAPRLILLDEAFAGIDDSARAHCMGLIREFDLDFVMTSEREWGCYAELPGVAICQLQRREGIDAVHVSRWSWDGRARRREVDPDRRFPPP